MEKIKKKVKKSSNKEIEKIKRKIKLLEEYRILQEELLMGDHYL